MAHEKRGVIEDGRTPPERVPADKSASDLEHHLTKRPPPDLEDHLTKRAADAVAKPPAR